jgi:transcriptional regulator with XRE-family HTH domain
MDARSRIAWNLRKIRTAKGLSQEALGVDAKVDSTYVSGIETGRFNPSVDLLERLAGALDTDIAKFFKMPDRRSKPPAPLPPGRKAGSRKS